MDASDPLGLVGSVLEGRYRVEALVGEGGMGFVYRGHHLTLEAPIAVKFLKLPDRSDAAGREAFLRTFDDEGKLLFALSKRHAAFVQVLDKGLARGGSGEPAPYLVLEWLEGAPLGRFLATRKEASGPLSLAEALALLAPAAEALGLAHAEGIVHRDVNPSNLFVVDAAAGGGVKLLDLGIAKVMSTSGEAAYRTPTEAGKPRGFAPGYAAPEQWNRARGATGPWTDVYAFALVLVELVTGRRALAPGADLMELAVAATSSERPTPRRRGAVVSDAVEAAFERALSPLPRERPASLSAFWSELVAAGALADAGHAAGVEPPRAAPLGGARAATAESDQAPDVQQARAAPTRSDQAPTLEQAPRGEARDAAPAQNDQVPNVEQAPHGEARGAVPTRSEHGPSGEQAPGGEAAATAAPAAARAWVDAVAGAQVGPARAAQPAPITHGLDAVAPASGGAMAATPYAADTAGGNAPRGAAQVTATSAPATRARRQRRNVALVAAIALAAGGGLGTILLLAFRGRAPSGGATASASSPPPGARSGTELAPTGESSAAPSGPCPASARAVGAGGSVGYAFCIDATEVTEGDYARCVHAGACEPAHPNAVLPDGRRIPTPIDEACHAHPKWHASDPERHPVNCVTIEQARACCAFAGMRLPTDAEWTRAAGGDDGRPYPWGRTGIVPTVVNGCGGECPGGKLYRSDGYPTTAPVGAFAAGASPYGALDMAGNVGEFTENPDGTRSLRGGSYYDADVRRLRVDFVQPAPPGLRFPHTGFRCARAGS